MADKKNKQHRTTPDETDFANMKMDSLFYGNDPSPIPRYDVYHVNNTAPVIDATEEKRERNHDKESDTW